MEKVDGSRIKRTFCFLLFVCLFFFLFFGLSFSPSATFVEAAKSFKDVRVGKAIK